MTEFQKKVITGKCLCGHSSSRHHGMMVANLEYFAQTNESRIPGACLEFGHNETEGQDGHGDVHCYNYVDRGANIDDIHWWLDHRIQTPKGAVMGDGVDGEPDMYRYILWRYWGPAPARFVTFVMLNPSKADGAIDDNTIRRCIGYAKAWGYNGIIVVNLFAYRATNPKELYATKFAIGPRTNGYVRYATDKSELIVCAWGRHGKFMDMGEEFMTPYVLFKDEKDIKKLHYLKLNNDDSPAHPLYLSKDLRPKPLF